MVACPERFGTGMNPSRVTPRTMATAPKTPDITIFLVESVRTTSDHGHLGNEILFFFPNSFGSFHPYCQRYFLALLAEICDVLFNGISSQAKRAIPFLSFLV